VDDVGIHVLRGPLTLLSSTTTTHGTHGTHGSSSDEEELVNLQQELLSLEIILREDPYVLSSKIFSNRLMTLHSVVMFNWYYLRDFHTVVARELEKEAKEGKEGEKGKEEGKEGKEEEEEEEHMFVKKVAVFHKQFIFSEIKYLRRFSLVAGNEFRGYNLNGNWIGNRMSGYSYSHTFDTGDDLNIISSTRIRIGTTINFQTMWAHAKVVRSFEMIIFF